MDRVFPEGLAALDQEAADAQVANDDVLGGLERVALDLTIDGYARVLSPFRSWGRHAQSTLSPSPVGVEVRGDRRPPRRFLAPRPAATQFASHGSDINDACTARERVASSVSDHPR